MATPETDPVNSPVAAKKTGLFEASAKTGSTVSVNVRVPDASLKRPVPPVIWGRPNSRVTSRHLDHLSDSRAFISSSKRPYGFT